MNTTFQIAARHVVFATGLCALPALPGCGVAEEIEKLNAQIHAELDAGAGDLDDAGSEMTSPDAQQLPAMKPVPHMMPSGAGTQGGGANEGEPSTNGDGGGPQVEDAGAPSDTCPRDQIPNPEHDTSPRTYTKDALSACTAQCPDANDAKCFDGCPGFAAFNDCVNTEAVACAAAPGAKCRDAYDALFCCAAASDCAADDHDCVKDSCQVQLAAWSDCVNADSPCIQAAANGCLLET